MTEYLSLIAPAVALIIAVGNAWWDNRRRKKDREESERLRERDRRAAEQLRQQEREEAARAHQAEQLAKLLTLYTTTGPVQGGAAEMSDREMKAILLTLPGHLATVLRIGLALNYTTAGVPLDPPSLARLGGDENADAGQKWQIFDRASAITNRGFEPRLEWVEAELAYDIAGLRGGDQDAVLAALKLRK